MRKNVFLLVLTLVFSNFILYAQSKENKLSVNSESLRQRLKQNAIQIAACNPALSGQSRDTAFIFDDLSMNFNPKSFSAIKATPKWFSRTQKPHSQLSGILEMQSCNSSDALLMNIFCYPEFKKWSGPKKLLGIADYTVIEFGWNPHLSNEKPESPTEIDMKIGSHIFESKLTESDFTSKEACVVESYENFDTVFDRNALQRTKDNQYLNYQLIRNILTAYKYNFYFTLFVDETRTDLIKNLFATAIAVKDIDLRERINFVTWQELTVACGVDLKKYITEKYFAH